MKEKQVESKIVKKAKELGFLTYKFSSPSNRGVPDRIFISPHGEVFFIEFKSAKGKLSQLQEKTIKDIIALDVRVFVIRDVITGMEILNLKGKNKC
jgi:hypothetical protein